MARNWLRAAVHRSQIPAITSPRIPASRTATLHHNSSQTPILTITMSPSTDRKAILEKLRKSIHDGNVIVGAGAGIGLSAKFIEAGGGDMIIIYNSGRFRMAGRGSLAGLMPYGNANDVVLDMVQHSLTQFAFPNLTVVGKRDPPGSQTHTSTGWSVRNRSFSRHRPILETIERSGLRWYPELPYSWPH